MPHGAEGNEVLLLPMELIMAETGAQLLRSMYIGSLPGSLRSVVGKQDGKSTGQPIRGKTKETRQSLTGRTGVCLVMIFFFRGFGFGVGHPTK
jgi:hypothetical protein